MKIFLSDSAIKEMENGNPTTQHYFWGGQTISDGKEVLWIGAESRTWLMILELLHNSGSEGKCLAEAIASRHGFIKNET